VITIGLVNKTQVHPREVFADVIAERATAIIVAHNHPSGNLEPSDSDRRLTQQLVEAGQILGIKVLDHVIISKKGFYSFSEVGEM
jgi:DNA repair protein RadC